MKLTAVLIAVITSFLITTSAHAFFLVDTGEPINATGWNIQNPSAVPGVENGSAARFTTLNPVIINSVGAWFGSNPGIPGSGSGTLTIALYDDTGAQIPGNTELFADAINVSTASGVSTFNNLTGLSWNINAGTYWIAVEGRLGDTFFGRIAGDFNGPGTNIPSPLANEAQFFGGTYFEYDDYNIGYRIEATDNSPSAAIPEPATMTLLGSSLLGLAGIRRKVKV